MFSVCVCVCVFLDLWMLCLYVERCLESLTCWLDLWLSSFLVAFISLCFPPWKTLFLQARQLLDKSLTDFFLSSFYFSFLDRSSTTSQSIKIFGFLLDRISTASRFVKISGFLLDTFSTTSSINQAKFLCSLSAR